MIFLFKYIVLILLSYLIGSIPFSYLTAKIMGNIDIRNYGSGNSGATNVLRTLGKKAGFIAFVGDFTKGFSVALIAKSILGVDAAVIFSAFVVLGHCYPIFLKFKGGKGVATTGGTIFGLYPLIGIILLVILILIVKFTRIVSLASISAAVLFPIISILLKAPRSFIYYSLFLGAFVVYKHKSNINRLIHGTESKIKL